jgi:hypothetical protein
MLRFFLFMVGVMAVGTSAAGEGLPCADTVPIQVMENTPQNSGTEIILSADESFFLPTKYPVPSRIFALS